MQLRGPNLNVWESYPKGHLGEIDASCWDLLSLTGCDLFWLSLDFFPNASSGREALLKGQTGVIFIYILQQQIELHILNYKVEFPNAKLHTHYKGRATDKPPYTTEI